MVRAGTLAFLASAVSALFVAPAAVAGWTPHPLPPEAAAVVDASIVTVDGTLGVDGSCTISAEVNAPAGVVFRADEVASDDEACRAQYRIGRVLPGTVKKDKENGDTAADAAGEAGATGGNAWPGAAVEGVTAAASIVKTAATLKQWFTDPASLTVASLRDSLQWNHTSSCITYAYWRRTATWLSATSWYLVSINDYFPTPTCSSASINSTAHMRNVAFCYVALRLPEFVDIYFDRNRVTGYPSGGYAYSWTYRINSTLGICWRLLSHHVTNSYISPWA